MTNRWLIPEIDHGAAQAARARQQQLTKPRGSLGQLEHIAIQLAGVQGRELPRARPAVAIIFAADHPVTRHGVSAYPSEVTRAMVHNFVAGGAAASVLTRRLDIALHIVDVGVAGDALEVPDGSVSYYRDPVATMPAGDLLEDDAMSEQTYEAALVAGAAAVNRLAPDVRLLVLGEMGIGNTTPASALAALLLDASASDLVGPGTGLDDDGMARKREVVAAALERARAVDVGPTTPHRAVMALGGRDIAALMGAMGRAMERRMTVLVDGFIVGAAALALVRAEPKAREHLIFAHQSREPGHRRVLESLGATPLLSLGMALGEASGALTAVPLVELACALHADMATFESAAVPDRDGCDAEGDA